MLRSKLHIFKIMTLIFKIWIAYPDLRFCQLIGNCFKDPDVYYQEDEELVQKLKERYSIEE